MKREEIIEKLKQLHNIGLQIIKCNEASDLLSDKQETIKEWQDNYRSEADALKKELESKLKLLYSYDMVGRFFIRITDWSSTTDSLQLIHVTDVYRKTSGTPYSQDVCYNVIGEVFYISFTKDGILDRLSYDRDTRYSGKAPAYLNSNDVYLDGMNGWMEVTKEQYDEIVKQYRFSLLPTETMANIKNLQQEIAFSDEDIDF